MERDHLWRSQQQLESQKALAQLVKAMHTAQPLLAPLLDVAILALYSVPLSLSRLCLSSPTSFFCPHSRSLSLSYSRRHSILLLPPPPHQLQPCHTRQSISPLILSSSPSSSLN